MYKKTAKQALSIFNKLCMQNYSRILMYHQIEDSDSAQEQFEHQIKYLSKNYDLIPLCDLASKIKKRMKIKYSVAITFDDGHQSVYNYAYPILKKYKAPATIFLLTGSIGGEPPWFYKLRALLNAMNKEQLKLLLTENNIPVILNNDAFKKEEVIEKFIDYLKSVAENMKNKIINKLEKDNSLTDKLGNIMLTWNQILEMSANGFDFGAHTCSHPILTKISINQARDEILGSKKCIEDKISKRVDLFCYPNGRQRDFNAGIKQILIENDFLCATTTIEGLNSPCSDLFELKRIPVYSNDILDFSFRIARGR